MARSKEKEKKKGAGFFRLRKNRKLKSSKQRDPGALEYIEEAVHVLRRAPVTLFLPYCIGTLPFLIAFLLFWNDMAYSGLARRTLPTAALSLTLLYLWMKCWQSVFTYHLHAFMSGTPAPGISFKQIKTLIQRQTFWHATAFIIMGPAILITIPLGRAVAFYQNITILDIRETTQSETFLERAIKQSKLWSGQATILVMLFFVFYLLVYMCWQTVIASIPLLGKILFGYESILGSSADSIFNSVTVPMALAFTVLSVDPIVKTTYFLRCYYGESRQNGEDLLVALHELRKRTGKAASILALIATLGTLFFAPHPTHAQEDVPLETVQPASSHELNDSIDRTLSKREYSWRFPRSDSSQWDLEEITWYTKLRDAMEDAVEWFFDLFEFENEREEKEASDWDLQGALETVAYIALFCFIAIIAFFIVKVLRDRQSGPAYAEAAPVEEALPDLTDEEVTADSLSLSRWVLYAKELLAQGSYRLAMRAYFLAQLAHFSDQGLIKVHRFKSNRDYYRELARRSHSPENLLDIYNEEVQLFEGSWYGERAVGPQEIESMEQHLKTLGVALG